MKDQKSYNTIKVLIAIVGFLLAIFDLPINFIFQDQLNLVGAAIGGITIGWIIIENFLIKELFNFTDIRIRKELKKDSFLSEYAKIQQQDLNNNIDRAVNNKRMSFKNGDDIIRFLVHVIKSDKRLELDKIISTTNFLLPGRKSEAVIAQILSTDSQIQRAWDSHLVNNSKSKRIFIIDSGTKGKNEFKNFEKHLKNNGTISGYKFVNSDVCDKETKERINSFSCDVTLFYKVSENNSDTCLTGASSEKVKSNEFDGSLYESDKQFFNSYNNKIKAFLTC